LAHEVGVQRIMDKGDVEKHHFIAVMDSSSVVVS